LNVFFDNCTSPKMARTLAGYLDGTSATVIHARDRDFHRLPDVEWIRLLSETGEEWLVVTGDGRLARNRAEREAFRRAGLRGVVLAPAYQKTPMARRCGVLVANWDNLQDFIARIDPPFLVEMKINLSSTFRVLPL
jgi:hypothetical protein